MSGEFEFFAMMVLAFALVSVLFFIVLPMQNTLYHMCDEKFNGKDNWRINVINNYWTCENVSKSIPEMPCGVSTCG